jgi:hypothetical protein
MMESSMARQNKIPRKTKAPRDSVRNFAASSTAPTERPAPVETASKPPRLVDKAEVLRRIAGLQRNPVFETDTRA